MTLPHAAPSDNGPPLLPQHLADLRRSELTDETIRGNGLYSTEDVQWIATAFRMRAQAAAGLGPCLVITYHDAAGRDTGYSRLKPDYPRADPKKDKPGKRKYEAPAGRPNRLYIPCGARLAIR